jgi:hypothetical protein
VAPTLVQVEIFLAVFDDKLEVIKNSFYNKSFQRKVKPVFIGFP